VVPVGQPPNDGPDSTQTKDLVAVLTNARQAGRVLVPIVDAQTSGDSLSVNFVRIEAPDPHDPASTANYIPVFTSGEALVASGLPDTTSYVSPVPGDLMALVGPDQWIALDPHDDVVAIKLGDLVRSWDSLPKS